MMKQITDFDSSKYRFWRWRLTRSCPYVRSDRCHFLGSCYYWQSCAEPYSYVSSLKRQVSCCEIFSHWCFRILIFIMKDMTSRIQRWEQDPYRQWLKGRDEVLLVMVFIFCSFVPKDNQINFFGCMRFLWYTWITSSVSVIWAYYPR